MAGPALGEQQPSVNQLTRFVLGLLALATGLFLSAGDIFLAAWNRAAGTASDIRARGPWLLAMSVPYFAVAILVIVLITAVAIGRRQRLALWSGAMASVVATLVAGAALYYDPTTSVWRILSPMRDWLGYAGAAVPDLAFLGVGVWLLVRPGRTPPVSTG